MTWDELPDQAQADLIEWYNVQEKDLDPDDRQRLAALYAAGQFHAWDCPDCGERVFVGEPDDWKHFQGVCQADHSSYPGDTERYHPEHIAKQCDDCRMMGEGTTERPRDPTGL